MQKTNMSHPTPPIVLHCHPTSHPRPVPSHLVTPSPHPRSISKGAYALYRAGQEAAAADGVAHAAALAEQTHFESLRNQVRAFTLETKGTPNSANSLHSE